MRIGVVGLGNIAQKAYMPVISAIPNVNLHIATRNERVLHEVASRYRVENVYRDAAGLLQAGLDAVMIHAATEAHPELVETFLNHNIHVFVDKPVSYDYGETQRLVELARTQRRLLMVGFNRRFAPLYTELRAIGQPDILLMQKNRKLHPEAVRTAILDDFIHVVDTLAWLLPGKVENVRVRSQLDGGKLSHIVVELVSGNSTGIGIMHRNSGYNEELLEVQTIGEKRVVRDLVETERLHGVRTMERAGDWTPTLETRGFAPMIRTFLEAVQNAAVQVPDLSVLLPQTRESVLLTHALCEEIISQVERQGSLS